MSKLGDKKKLAKSICDAAKLYKKNLVGRKFLYVFDNRYIEVLFKKRNYKHLTGVATSLLADSFYQNAVKGTLAGNQIWFDSDHPYNLCCRKVKHLCDIAKMSTNESFMLEEITTSKIQFKFGITDLNFTLCFDKEYDDNGNAAEDYYIVKSLRDEDCFSKSNNVYEITHIFSCSNDEKKYSNLLYMDKRMNLYGLPNEVKGLLGDCFMSAV
jgi:hypothetical protein